MSASSSAISLNDARLTLMSEAGEVNILRGVDLTIGRGERVSVVGPSGSGKTSLLMLLGGLERPTGGKVEVLGTSLGGMSEDALALFRRKRVGVVFQAFHLAPAMTALENVAVPLELAGDPDAFAKAEKELAAVGLGHRLTHYPGQLSGGEQQRVALARAFVGEPELLLADEPTGNLDGETGRKVIDLMFAMTARTGATLVLITHDMGLAGECDRIIKIADGVIVGEERGATAQAA